MRVQLFILLIVIAFTPIYSQIESKLPISFDTIQKRKILKIKMSWVNSDTEHYEFDSEYKLIKSSVFTQAKTIIYQSIYNYSNNRISSENNYTAMERADELVYAGRKEYFYNSSALLETVKEYSWGLLPDPNKLSKETTYRYNSKRQIIMRIEQTKYGIKEYEYDYDNNGLLKSIRTRNNRDELEIKYYEYDNLKRLKIVKYYYERDNKMRSIEEYKYNSDNLPIELWATHYSTNKPELILKYDYILGE